MIATPASTCAVYVRVSTEEQLEGHSIEAQERLVSDYARIRGWDVFKVYADKGRSGTNVHRPEFQRMLSDLRAGLFRVIVVHKIDRFSRNLVDGYTLIKEFNETGAALVSVTENLDMTTPMGKAFIGMLLIWSELYIDNLRTEISKGKKQRALKGFWNGTLSWGYITPRRLETMLIALNQAYKSRIILENDYEQQATLLDNALDGTKDLHETTAIIDPFTAPGVLLAYNEYSTGLYSDRDVAHILNDAGYRISARKGTHRLRKDTVEDILQNRFYVGETSYGRKIKGQTRQWMPGNHEPLIDSDLFERCQEIRGARGLRYGRGMVKTKSTFLLDMVTCLECGTRYIGMTRRGRREYVDPATHKEIECHMRPRRINADTAEQHLADILMHIQIPQNWQQRILARLPDETPKAVRQNRQALEGKLTRLHWLFVEGELTEGDYLSMKAQIQGELDSIPSATAGVVVDTSAMVDTLNHFPTLWQSATADEKKKLYQMFYRHVYIAQGEIKAIEPTQVLWILLRDTMELKTGRTGILSLMNSSFISPGTPIHLAQELLAA